jgi:porin
MGISNPASVNILTGTGWLGRILGLKEESGARLGGLWIGDANWLMAGGLKPNDWSFNSLTLLDFSLDSDKAAGLKGGMFGVEFLHFSGQPTNDAAGAFPGYNALPGPPPLDRVELYQLWWRQELFDRKMIVRVGKQVATFDFNNVIRPVTAPDEDTSYHVPAVTGLIYVPIFVNPTILGRLPGYYNSATGVTTSVFPTKDLYISYGVYDGNEARGVQTGMRGPPSMVITFTSPRWVTVIVWGRTENPG